MITKITLNKIASYKQPVHLETDKKVNLVYGLNGAGKSILSNFLYQPDDSSYNNCFIDGLDKEEIVVYNQSFIQDYFYESDNLKGIFTLSKKNKEAEQKIKNAEKLIAANDTQRKNKTDSLDKLEISLDSKQQQAENKTWEIKTNYTGGDRVLEFCLEGLKGKKNKLFRHLLGIPEPEKKPKKDIDTIKKEVRALSGENAKKYDLLPTINFEQEVVETDDILNKQIVGNENSTVFELISKLKNSDWVKEGLVYLPEVTENPKDCPFCQQKTITQSVIDNLKDYFNESYENDIQTLNNLYIKYKEAINNIPQKAVFKSNPIIQGEKEQFDNKYNNLTRILNANLKKLEDKIKSPSQEFKLNSSIDVLKILSDFVAEVNNKIDVHNNKIDNRKAALKSLTNSFWNFMRWEYNQTISNYQNDKSTFNKDSQRILKAIETLDNKITEQNEIISEQQKNTVNIEEAVNNINKGLIDLGISDFCISKYSENLYKIARGSTDSEIFQSLSEGEKMIISFLYFLELCRGKRNATDVNKKKIIVIDDPISSLSHIYIFNIGQLIKYEFLRSDKYEQVFLLTHSLYFFYELTETKHDKRKEIQNLYRIVKNSEGSYILTMKYEEIQNDYHSYWQIIKDDKQPPALIANCMRNIVEYFFNFIEKRDLGNVFQKPQLQGNKYQAFGRYINRESHSLGQNIFDIKEFNYSDFKDGLRLLFEQNGYDEHYKRMMK